MANSTDDHGHCCSGEISNPSVRQTLDELEFERGIWSSALNGEVEKIQQHLTKGVNPNSVDTSGYTALVSFIFIGSTSIITLFNSVELSKLSIQFLVCTVWKLWF